MHVQAPHIHYSATSLKSWKAISPIGINVTVPCSVWLPVTFVHCAQTAEDIDTISFAYDSPMSLPDHDVNIWLNLFHSSNLNFAAKWLTPVGLSVVDIRWQIATERSEIAQWSQWRAYSTPPSLFRMVSSLNTYDLLYFKMGVPKAFQDQLRDACCCFANMIDRCHGGAVVRASYFWSGGLGFDSPSARYQAPRSAQPSIPPGSVNRVPASTGWG